MAVSFAEILKIAGQKTIKKICVVNAHDDDILKSVAMANSQNIATSILIGNKEMILKIAKEENIDISSAEIIDERDYFNAINLSVTMIKEKKADILMKGKVQTPDLMRAVMNKESGIRSSDLLSHISVLETTKYHKLLFLTDAGINISPDLSKKVLIVNNSVKLAKALGISLPKVAGICAIELVNPDMPATIDSALLTMMNKRGQLKDCIFDGPLALDNAVSKEASKIKGIDSPVSGDVDILLMPNIEAGNCSMKSLTYLETTKFGGLVIGAKCPIVVTSRADSYESKLNSIALAAAILD